MAAAMADFLDVDYFEESLSSIELVQQLASHQVQLNLFQCRYLSSKLAETGSSPNAKAETLRAVFDRDDIRRKALLMLNFTVKRAEKLVRNCFCEMETWLESAVTLAQIKEDIVDILLDLQWWTSMVDIAIASVMWMSSGQQIEFELLMVAEANFEILLRQFRVPSNELDEAVAKDMEELMMRVREVRASQGSRNGDPQMKRQYLLATHVRSRLENKVFETMGHADLNVYDLGGFDGFDAVDTRWLGRRCALKICCIGSHTASNVTKSLSSRSEDKPLGYLVNPVWPLESTSETTLDVIFFEGNVGSRKYLSCKDTWVQRGKPDVRWPRDWLPKDFKGDMRVLLLEYSISEGGVEGVLDELHGGLVFSDRWNRGHTWKHPVVLVGHSLGCVVIEQLVVSLHKRVEATGSLNDEMETERARVSKAFLASLAGCFFYAPPWKGLVPSEDLLKHVFGGLSYSRALFADLCLDSPKLKEVLKEFGEARSEHVKLMALIEGFHTRGRTVVPPVSIEDFPGPVVHLSDSNHNEACKPTNKEHPAYAKLVEFIRDVSNSRMVVLSTSGDKEPAAMDFDESPASSVSPTSLRAGFHSSTIKEYRSYQRVVGLFVTLRKVVSGPGHFYANQCRVLKEQLSLANEILIKGRASRGVSSGDPLWPESALTELHRVLRLGKTLIKDCQYNKLCLKAYLRQGERAQAFSEILKEIVWCKSVVKFYHDNMGRVSSTAIDEFPQVRLGNEEQHLLQKASDDDQKELQAVLDSWIVKHSCSAKECGRPLREDQADNFRLCLAAQISARVSNSEGDVIGDVKDDHTTVLWKTSQDALKDGIVIGTGSSGTVTETTWLEDKYAKKEFDMAPSDFEDEANALAKLNHPHIVKVSAYCVGSHVCFFLMDIMPGHLRKYMIKRMQQLRIDQPFSLPAAIDLMLQISEAMSYMNSKEMVHRDLKPLNILVKPVDDPELCRAGFVTAKLADFGLAKSKHEITSHSHLTRKNLGTSRWRAPEMFKEAKPVTEKALPWQADVYSFGIVCSEILTGSVPFHHVTFQMHELHSLLIDPHSPLRPELPKNCPEMLVSLIRECWQTSPADRPTFQVISKRLRYLKGIHMLTASNY